MSQPLADEPNLHSAFAGRRVLITGGAGFIASHLAAALETLAARVVLVDERPPSAMARDRAAWPVLVNMGVGSDAFRQLLQRSQPFDYIFHLAARAYAAESVNWPTADFAANLVATLHLLEQLRELAWPTRLLFASTAAVYGNPTKLPIEETDPTVPIAPYGVSKLAAERYVAIYARLYGLSAASLRLFSVYGPYQTKQVVFDFLTRLRANPGELVVWGDGTQARDLVYVADVVRAFLVVAARGASDGAVYNVASGVATTTAELARQIVALQQPDAVIRFSGATRPGDPERWLGRAAPLAAIGGAPRCSLTEGLSETVTWFNQRIEPSASPVRIAI